MLEAVYGLDANRRTICNMLVLGSIVHVTPPCMDASSVYPLRPGPVYVLFHALIGMPHRINFLEPYQSYALRGLPVSARGMTCLAPYYQPHASCTTPGDTSEEKTLTYRVAVASAKIGNFPLVTPVLVYRGVHDAPDFTSLPFPTFPLQHLDICTARSPLSCDKGVG